MYDPSSYLIATGLFFKLLGFIYFVVFFPFLFQILGLIGEKGILPAAHYLRFLKSRLGKRAYRNIPTLFWFNASDKTLMAVVIAGCALSVLLMLGVYPFLLLPLLYILYLSIIGVGQDFLSFGWELFLLEITVNAFFLSLTQVPNPFVWISINFLLFRFHLQAGAVKLQSRDPNWLNLTALCYHYQTQPIPNPIAWYVHKMPVWFHKLSCLIMLVIEIIITFGVFGGEDLRFFVFTCFFGLQFFIALTGNFSYLNYMTAVLSVILISDSYLAPVFGQPPDIAMGPDPLIFTLIASGGGIILFTLQLIRLWHHFLWNPFFDKVLGSIYRFFIANRYGIFAVMTTKRYEIVIEGSDDGTEWKEYLFKYKPSEVSRRPPWIAPYQPRLDWQAWFLPFSGYHTEQWFQQFLYRLLKGEKCVLKLLRENPFQKSPPKYIRAQVYDYTYTSFKERTETGDWWNRKLLQSYSPTLERSNP